MLRRDPQTGSLALTEAGASHLAGLALKCLQQPYPNKISHVLNDSSDAQTPQQLHPAFYGCFDWHSAVHGHWMLVRLLRAFPQLPEAAEIRRKLEENLQPAHIAGEIAYLQAPGRKGFERMYGWAWLLQLALELESWTEDAQAQRWGEALRPLADTVAALYLDFLPRQVYPIRVGEHTNTAFGLSMAWDYAAYRGLAALQAQIRESALQYYGMDQGCPADWEPNGADFLSPCLEEANLMARVLEGEAFAGWYGAFLPGLPATLRTPATVSDRTDGKLVHLDGLNLSRAWCMQQIAGRLPAGSVEAGSLRALARRHIEATLPHIADGNYEGEHWLASFAVYALLGSGSR
ncbi:MAG: DUF2891 domain-containing protein [Bacteroidetes bacterium]|nr:MAG: DUF2891 domain-containing protein [Bacteroidota bacterium]